jgi:hypothetical protein
VQSVVEGQVPEESAEEVTVTETVVAPAGATVMTAADPANNARAVASAPTRVRRDMRDSLVSRWQSLADNSVSVGDRGIHHPKLN